MKERIKDTTGQVLIEFAVAATVLLIVLAFAVDLGVTQAEKARMTQIAQQALSECEQPATALLIKNSSTPATDMTRALVNALREDGFGGAITAYYFEPDKAASTALGIPSNRRVYIYGVTLEKDVYTVFSVGAGNGAILISERAWLYSIAYSTIEPYRPSVTECGYLHVDAGESAEGRAIVPVASASVVDEVRMPGGQGALNTAVNEAKSWKE